MIKVIAKNIWLRYKTLLSTSHELYVSALPEALPYLGIIEGSFDYVLPETILERLRQWLSSRGTASVFYFLTEGHSESHPTDYEISVSELTEATLSALNNGFENVLVGTDFSWRCLWIMREICMSQVPMISLPVCRHGGEMGLHNV